jgi:hypothetical protein
MMVAMISTSRLADVFVEVADTLVDDFDLMDFLNNLAVHAADVTGTSAVGLMLTDHTGTLRFMAASTADARLLELFQLQHSEGPCVDCHRNGEPVQETDLANAESRWPTFAPRAVAPVSIPSTRSRCACETGPSGHSTPSDLTRSPSTPTRSAWSKPWPTWRPSRSSRSVPWRGPTR